MTEAHLHASGRVGNQDRVEFLQFLGLIIKLGVRRYLEVGARNGDTWFDVMLAIAGSRLSPPSLSPPPRPDRVGEGAYGVAIDLGENESSRGNLKAARMALIDRWIGANVIFGRSEDQKTVEQAVQWGTFDLILIDGDHTAEGVRKDWQNYCYSAPVIAFHDIAAAPGHLADGKPCGVPELWAELKQKYRHKEIINPGSNMGFGLLFTDGHILA